MEKHAVDRYLDFLRYLGADVKAPEFLISIDEENKNKISRILQINNIDKKDRFVAVSPIALWETKLWDDEKIARLCDRIMEESGVKVIFTGSDRGKLEQIQSRMRLSSINLGGETTLRDLAFLYQTASLLITTDSGPMHIAAAVGTPVIALFGPTDPNRTGPYGKNHTIIQKELSCSPCFLKKCTSMKCMSDITVEEVFQAVKNKL